MSWMARLYETYQQALTWELAEGEGKLLPISHTLQNAHINIVIDGEGNFKRASVLEKTQVILPATESSAGRTAGEAAHPLADKLQYVAADYSSHGGRKESYFTSYEAQLSAWCESEFTHPKAQAIHRYIKKGKVISDLIAAKIVYVDDSKQLLTTWIGEVTAENPLPLLFKVLPKEKGMLDQGNALVCWSVELENEPRSDTWTDESLHQSWIAFDAKNNIEQDQLCFVTGLVQPIASNHPAKLRHTGDKAKLVSANDKDGFTFRGRFTNSNEANSI
ncbi:MAG: CRISPR-associated protein Csd1 family, partial [Pseudomonadota bacterium]